MGPAKKYPVNLQGKIGCRCKCKISTLSLQLRQRGIDSNKPAVQDDLHLLMSHLYCLQSCSFYLTRMAFAARNQELSVSNSPSISSTWDRSIPCMNSQIESWPMKVLCSSTESLREHSMKTGYLSEMLPKDHLKSRSISTLTCIDFC